MAQVMRAITLKTAAADVWETIGGFQALPDWHPWVATSTKEEIGGAEHRRLGLEGGGEILEKHWGTGPMSYAYDITESPLPVADYRAMLCITSTGAGASTVVWMACFTPTADDAEDVIGGIFDAGVKSLAERFGH
ncbi:MAG: SRPBCC family protein [Pseudomonadota bacterium]